MTIFSSSRLPYLIVFALYAGLPSRAAAQVIPDGTLGPEASEVMINGVTIDGAAADLIQGGALREENLFHSFEQFSIGEDGLVYFANPAGVERIFGRVTGELPSDIFGTLGVNGGADLYFLNPNGIVFGPNAQLDVNGSFVVSTADAFEFAGLGTYSARNPAVPSPLLTVLPSALQFGQVLPGNITVQSSFLEVLDSENLVLLGGDVTVDGGELIAFEGRVEVGAVAGAATVGLTPDGRLTFAEETARGDVAFENALVDVRRADNGDIGVTARNIDVINSTLLAGIFGTTSTAASQAGDIVLDATERVRVDNSFVQNDISDNANGGNGGNGGSVVITASVLEVLNASRVSASTFGQGNAGQVVVVATEAVTVDVDNFRVADFFFIDPVGIVSQVGSDATGDSGGVSITTGNLSVLNDAEVGAKTEGQGNAGQVVVVATEGVTVDGERSFILSQVLEGATGNSGEVSITTGNLSVLNGAQVSASTLGQGNAGQVVVVATEEVTVDGDNSFVDGDNSFIVSQVSSGATGDSGGVSITTGNLSVLNGTAVSANTFGQGNAGQVVVVATGEVTVDGESDIVSQVGRDARGNSSGVSITTGNLSVLNDAQVSATTAGQGNAGQVVVVAADEVTVDGNNSFIASQVGEGARGNSSGVSITTGNLAVLNDAQISASTFGEGNAGQVVVVATDEVILDGEATVDSQVGSSAMGDNGGVSITTGTLSVFNNAQVVASTLGQGNAGQAVVVATDEVILDGDLSGIASQVASSSTGDSEGVSITTGTLSLLNGAEVSSATFGPGNAGPLEIDTREIILSTPDSLISADTDGDGTGGGIRLSSPNTLTISGPGEVSVETRSTGPAGNIEVTAQQLRLTGGVTLSASTEGTQPAGDIRLNIADTLDIDGGSTVTSSTLANSTGTGGNIVVNAPRTTLDNGSIAVNSQGAGSGGQVAVTGDLLILLNSSNISATTFSSDGGNLAFDLRDVLILRDGSEISTEAGTEGDGGDGGDITINTQFLVAAPNENSDIVANAFDGDGGNVNITVTGGIFGIEPRPDRTSLSDITASSRNGVSGTIAVESPDVDPTEDAAELPTALDAPDVIQSCREAFVQTGSEFVVTGRGGIPQGPLDSAPAAPWQDILPIETAAQSTPEPESTTDLDEAALPEPIAEAQGWTVNEQGQIVLVADDSQQATVGQPVTCQG